MNVPRTDTSSCRVYDSPGEQEQTAAYALNQQLAPAWQPDITENDGRSNFSGFLLRHQRIGSR
jgi:hypothetical protein